MKPYISLRQFHSSCAAPMKEISHHCLLSVVIFIFFPYIFVFKINREPFRFIAGSFHYFRALPETWQQKLRTLRASGLDTVTTYVEWALHNPKDGVYNWEGIADVERFIRLAAAEDLYVILRPGPYICAERDNVCQ